jgi:hypothetical protein
MMDIDQSYELSDRTRFSMLVIERPNLSGLEPGGDLPESW